MSKLKDGIYRIGIIKGNKRLAKELIERFSELLSFSYFDGREVLKEEDLLYKEHTSKVIYTEDAEDFFKLRHLLKRSKLPEQYIVLLLITEKIDHLEIPKDIEEHASFLYLDSLILQSEILSRERFSKKAFESFLIDEGKIERGENHVQ